MARASATRCCCPPESWDGRRSANRSSRTRATRLWRGSQRAAGAPTTSKLWPLSGTVILEVAEGLLAGGVTGVGFGEGRQKFGFLPEAHNDFIFAMVGEEWGLLGAKAFADSPPVALGNIIAGFNLDTIAIATHRSE